MACDLARLNQPIILVEHNVRQAADKQGLIDSRDPDAFKYTITAREVTA
jgi:hypothetical protein